MTRADSNEEIKRRYRLPVGSASLLNLQVMGMKIHKGYRYLFWLSGKF